MSLFRTIELPCPSCEEKVPFSIVDSVNAHRAPQYRDKVLDRTFQQETCGACGTSFRMDPEFSYVDASRDQWIAAYPIASLSKWTERETHARYMFNKTFGKAAPKVARELGAALRPRVVFGWPALREKLVIDEEGLDDRTLELTKLLIWRGLPSPEPDPKVELRLLGATEDVLAFAWQVTATGESGETIQVPRALYDGVAEDLQSWAMVLEKFEDALFVDLKRILIDLG